MDFGIKGKVVIVTDGATANGCAIARALHEESATVVINGRTQAKLEVTFAAIGPNAHAVVTGLWTKQGAMTPARCAAGYSPVGFLVNNIGVFDICDFFAVTDEAWQDHLQQ